MHKKVSYSSLSKVRHFVQLITDYNQSITACRAAKMDAGAGRLDWICFYLILIFILKYFSVYIYIWIRLKACNISLSRTLSNSKHTKQSKLYSLLIGLSNNVLFHILHSDRLCSFSDMFWNMSLHLR